MEYYGTFCVLLTLFPLRQNWADLDVHTFGASSNFLLLEFQVFNSFNWIRECRKITWVFSSHLMLFCWGETLWGQKGQVRRSSQGMAASCGNSYKIARGRSDTDLAGLWELHRKGQWRYSASALVVVWSPCCTLNWPWNEGDSWIVWELFSVQKLVVYARESRFESEEQVCVKVYYVSNSVPDNQRCEVHEIEPSSSSDSSGGPASWSL